MVKFQLPKLTTEKNVNTFNTAAKQRLVSRAFEAYHLYINEGVFLPKLHEIRHLLKSIWSMKLLSFKRIVTKNRLKYLWLMPFLSFKRIVTKNRLKYRW